MKEKLKGLGVIISTIIFISDAIAIIKNPEEYLWLKVSLIIIPIAYFIFCIVIEIAKCNNQTRIKRPAHNKIGVVVSFYTTNEDSKKFFNESFIEMFTSLFEKEIPYGQVIIMPNKLTIEYHKKGFTRKIDTELKRSNTLLFLHFEVKNDKASYYFNLYTTYLLPNFAEEINKILDNDKDILSKIIDKCRFDYAKNVRDVETYELYVRSVCEYFISITQMLKMEFDKSITLTEKILSNLSAQLTDKTDSYYKIRKLLIRNKICASFLFYLRDSRYLTIAEYLDKYIHLDGLLSNIEPYARMCKHEFLFDYYLIKARHIFISCCKTPDSFSLQDYSKAKAANNMCKINGRKTNKSLLSSEINDVFFAAFEEEPFNRIDKRFNKLSHRIVSEYYNPIILISFLEEVSSYFPNKATINFLLGEYYECIQDLPSSIKNYMLALEKTTNTTEQEYIQTKIDELLQ